MSRRQLGASADQLQALFEKSMASFRRGDLAAAMRFGDRLLELSGEAGPAIVWGVRLRLETKRFQDAIDLGLRGLGKNPGLSGLVGQAYEEMGNLAEAQAYFERACAEQPDNVNWLYQNASLLSRLARDFESMELLRAAVRMAPDPRALMILAGQELTFGDPAAALLAADRVLRAEPLNEEALSLSARSLMAQGRFEEADERWTRAISRSPAKLSLPLQRAICLIRHGEFEKGIDGLRALIDRDPFFALAYAQIAAAKRVTEDNRGFVEDMEALLLNPAMGEEDKIALEFALGKSYDNLKEYDKAISHFDEANRLQYRPIGESGGFDREGYAANMKFRTRAFSREVVEEAAKAGNPSELPIFGLGMIRSGTTLAEQILSSHHLVSGAGELDFWINADLRILDYGRGCVDVPKLRTAAEAYLRLLNGFSKGRSHRVVDKQPGNLILAGALHMAFPNARIIHMRRHQVDTAISIWTTHLRTSTRFVNDKGNIAWAFQQHDRLMQHWREVLPGDRYMDVSYESLIEDRESVTRRILDFCGLPWSDACLSPEKNDKFVITPSLWQVRQPVYRTSIERWKNYEPWLGELRQLLPAYKPPSG